MPPSRRFKYPPTGSSANTSNRGNSVNTGGYRSNVSGWVNYNGKEYYFKSLWEMNYAAYLQWLAIKGDIKAWDYEPATFCFPKDKYKAGPYYYKPDFRVIELSGKTTWYEIKGYMNNESKKKTTRYKTHHEEKAGRLIIVDKSQIMDIAKMKRIIPNWLDLDTAKLMFMTKRKDKFVWVPETIN